jgi:putative transposase
MYNQTISMMKLSFEQTGETVKYITFRKSWYDQLCTENEWVKDIPSNIMYEAMRKASHDYIMCLKKRKAKQVSKLPCCRKGLKQTFSLLKNCINKDGIYTRRLGKMEFSEELPKEKHDCRVMFKYGRWYLLVPVSIQQHAEQSGENQARVAAIDPGVRTFATVFSHNGIAQVGEGSFRRIVRLAHSLDKLLSEITKAKARKKKRLKRAANSLRRKIRDLVEDMHYQTLGWIFRNFDTLILPECNFTSAVSRIRRRIRKKSVRSLLTWAFGLFRKRAVSVAGRIGGRVFVVDEAYTSKTANWTGEIVHNLGGARSISSGGLRFDRDVNGALGIYLKALLGEPTLRQAA